VNLPAIQNSTYYNGALITTDQNAFRDHIKIERGLELSLECVRWIDLKRWGLSDPAIINELKSRDDDFNHFIIGKSDCMPIPQIEVDNNSNLKQNPNY
jgi:starch-binding outer membrane protein, SusD/RagB family